jgi:hypothetical protein
LNIKHKTELSSQIPQTGGVDEASIFQDFNVSQLPDAHHSFEDFTLPTLSPLSPQAAKKHNPHHFDISSNMDIWFILNCKRICKPSSKAAAIAVVINNSWLIIAWTFA